MSENEIPKVMMKNWCFPISNIGKRGNSQALRPIASVRDAKGTVLMSFAGSPYRSNHEAVAMASEFCEVINRMNKRETDEKHEACRMKIYVASSWRNEYQQHIVDALRNAGHEVYDFKHPTKGDAGFHWSEIDPKWQEWDTPQYVAALAHDYAKFGFNQDFNAMKAADACVLVLPCGRSAHLEAGWMKGAGKKVCAFIPFDYKIEPELMYKMLDCITTDVRGVLSWLAQSEVVNEHH